MEFFGISFKYGESGHLILNGLCLHIKAGEAVALVGPSGGGKTTLVKLLLRLYNPLDGQYSAVSQFRPQKFFLDFDSKIKLCNMFLPLKNGTFSFCVNR